MKPPEINVPNALPYYQPKDEVWWNRTRNLKKWIDEKYDYCLFSIMLALQETNGFAYAVIYDILSHHNTIKGNDEKEWNGENLLYCFQKFTSLVSEINKYTIFVANKQCICAFFGINVLTFNSFKSCGDDEVQQVYEIINDYIISSQANAGQLGYAGQSLTTFMLKAENAGQGLMTAKESKVTTANENRQLTSEQITEKLNALSSKRSELFYKNI